MFYEYKCWPNYLQEPYVLLRSFVMNSYLLVYRNDSITLFNEAFINYGFNKISYVETLRREEYRFILAGMIYAFDLPHLPWAVYIRVMNSRSKFQKSHANNTQGGNYMTNYYYMQKLIARTKGNQNILKVCK